LAGIRRVRLEYERIDWPGLYKKLCVLAFRLTRGQPDVLDGISAEDLAVETLIEFFGSSDALGWDGRSLTAFLCGVLRNKFLDRLRRQRRAAGSLDDADFAMRVPANAAGELSAHDALEAKQWIAGLKSKLAGDTDLEDLLDAIASTNGDHNINQQIADDLGTTVADVVNRKKRLKRLLGQRGTM
jgi:DNA-directed RNA polymerase specialized sigma24 family protein